ncbi:MAG: putative SOS response-associated peptidase YedK [Bacteroidia bacterium]|jgi:putative SOS response-associated peptidase YedK
MLRKARHYHDEERIGELEELILPYLQADYHQVSGFNHPTLLIYTQDQPTLPMPATWGLVPSWVKSEEQKKQIWNKTLNARGETIFEKAAFKSSARNKRCVLHIDGFYEHFHKQGKTYPYYIAPANKSTLGVAALSATWFDAAANQEISTFSIVTTKGNRLMSGIHNNPQLSEARMPAFLLAGQEDLWLKSMTDPTSTAEILEQIKPYPNDALVAHTVRKIRGKNSLYNDPRAAEPYEYLELSEQDDQYSLF